MKVAKNLFWKSNMYIFLQTYKVILLHPSGRLSRSQILRIFYEYCKSQQPSQTLKNLPSSSSIYLYLFSSIFFSRITIIASFYVFLCFLCFLTQCQFQLFLALFWFPTSPIEASVELI